MPIPGPFQAFGEFCLQRHPTPSLIETPRFHERTNRDIKGSSCFVAIAHCIQQNPKKLRCYNDSSMRSLSINGGKLTVRSVITHEIVETVDLLESPLDAVSECTRIFSIGNHGKNGAHRLMMPFIPLYRPA